MDIGGVESLLSSIQQAPPLMADASILRVGRAWNICFCLYPKQMDNFDRCRRD